MNGIDHLLLILEFFLKIKIIFFLNNHLILIVFLTRLNWVNNFFSFFQFKPVYILKQLNPKLIY